MDTLHPCSPGAGLDMNVEENPARRIIRPWRGAGAGHKFPGCKDGQPACSPFLMKATFFSICARSASLDDWASSSFW